MSSLGADVDVSTQDASGQRRMSVADTLAQATKALRTHRTWMRRRISVAPLEEDAEEDGRVEREIGWEDAEAVNVDGVQSGADGQESPRKSNSRGNFGARLLSGAPPTLALQGFGPSAAYASGQEWVEFLMQKRKQAKVEPARTLRSVAEEIEASPKSKRKAGPSARPAWDSSAHVSKREPLGPLNADAFRHVLASGAGRDWGGQERVGQHAASNQTATKVKKRKSSKGSVAPSPAGSSQGDQKENSGAESAAIFISSPPNVSSPLHGLTSIHAWGSQSSLRETTESLDGSGPPATGKMEGSETLVDSGGSPKDSDKEDLEEGSLMRIVARSAPLRPTEPQNEPTGGFRLPDVMAPSSLRPPAQVKEDPNISQNTSDASTLEHEDAVSVNHLEALQSSTSATVVAVSPAPRDQRSSYALHSKSKLEISESGQVLINPTLHPSQNKAEEAELSSADESRPARGPQVVSSSVPEAVLQMVLPARKQRKSGASAILLSTHISTPSSGHWVSPPTSTQAAHYPSHSGQTGLTGLSAGSTPNASLDKGVAGASETAIPPVNGASEDISLTTKQDTLHNLHLPPLKGTPNSRHVYIDGRQMVNQLPPLKLQPPSSTPLREGGGFSRRRARAPPPYSIHRHPGAMALAPPCPEYGMEQPLEREVLKSIARRRSEQLEATDSASLTPNSSLRPPSDPPSGLGSRQSSVGEVMSVTKRGSQSSVGSGGRQTRKPSEDSTLQSSQVLQQTDQSFMTSATPEVAEEQLNTLSQSADPLSISQMPTGPRPLHLAAKSGNLRQLQSLIAQGHDVDMPDHEGKTPLMYCITSRGVHLSCADAIIREGANLNRQSLDGSTATHLAAFVGAVSLIELMLMNGANPDIRDFDGRLPIHWGTTPRSPKCIDVLMKYSSLDLNTTDDAGMTPLMWAAYHNNSTITAYLLDHGADCEEKDMDGYTTMHWAVHKYGIQCLQMLLKPDMTYFKDHKGRTIMHHAAETGSMAACELVLKMRPDAVYDSDKMGRSPLHYAAACSRVDVCALLLDRGCDASQKDTNGQTPLDYARVKKLDYVVALLTCHGTAVADFARVSRSTSVSTLLSRAVSFPHLLPSSPLSSPSPSTHSLLTPHTAWGNGPVSTGMLTQGETSLDSDSPNSSTAVAIDATEGGYLGRFTTDKREPLQHYFFWLNPSAGTICWSREVTTHRKVPEGEARILEAYEGPSNALRNTSLYTQNTELYKNVFSVMTDNGVMDLMAYNEQAYQQWVRGVACLAKGGVAQLAEENNKIEDCLRQSRPEDVIPTQTGDEDGNYRPLTPGNAQGGRDNQEPRVPLTAEGSGRGQSAELKGHPQDLPVEMDDSCGDERAGAYHSGRTQRTSLHNLFQPTRRPSQPHPLTSTPTPVSMETNEVTPNSSSFNVPTSLVLLDDII